MILKKITLYNIRSYTNETINFPNGKFLLSGDMGSGKTTILISIEFALFGFMKGEISGFDLLRHGEKTGSVELTFEINKKEITIKRVLKRLSSGIQQDSGYLIIDGVKTDLVAKELKSRILKLLGYSENMLNKSKSLIYRYTVYTPQEDMKRIILLNPSERIDTLRSIFGIDKYKIIRENSSFYNRELKRKISYKEGEIKDLDELKSQLINKKNELETIRNESTLQQRKLDEIKKLTLEKKEIVELKRKEYDTYMSHKNNLRLLEQKNENHLFNLKRIEQKIDYETKKINELLLEISNEKKINEEKLLQIISLLQKKIIDERKNQIELIRKISEEEYKIKEQNKIILNIKKLDNCPTCLQIVDENHKESICKKSGDVITESDNNLKNIVSSKNKIDQDLIEYEKKLGDYLEIKRKNELIKLKSKTLNEKNLEIGKLKKDFENEKTQIELLNKNKEELSLLLKSLQNSSIEYETSNKNFLETLKIEKDESIKLARFEAMQKNLLDTINLINDSITSKELVKSKIFEMKKLSNYLENDFDSMILNIEKHAMNTIYHEFNSLVSNWFSHLIGDENISLKLDSEFTPILEQNGYETEISNLSGGEKTAVALAYRLALNRIINEKIASINTNDLIILDEPTEGFSSEQLDRVNEVLNDLLLSQIIIVSHESKIEGFVDEIIRIEKQNHESKIVV